MAQPLTPPQIRDAELPRALRGFDVKATRGFLADAAGALSAVMQERDELRAQVEELSVKASQNPTDVERFEAVLLAAKRVADDLVTNAAEEAAEIRAGAERHRREFVAFLQSVLEQLEGVESVRPVGAEPTELDGELLAQLPLKSRDEFPSSF